MRRLACVRAALAAKNDRTDVTGFIPVTAKPKQVRGPGIRGRRFFIQHRAKPACVEGGVRFGWKAEIITLDLRGASMLLAYRFGRPANVAERRPFTRAG
jgi:hypothetical protein